MKIILAFLFGFGLTFYCCGRFLDHRYDARIGRIEQSVQSLKAAQATDHEQIAQHGRGLYQLRQTADGYYVEVGKLKTQVTRQHRSIRALARQISDPGVTVVSVR